MDLRLTFAHLVLQEICDEWRGCSTLIDGILLAGSRSDHVWWSRCRYSTGSCFSLASITLRPNISLLLRSFYERVATLSPIFGCSRSRGSAARFLALQLAHSWNTSRIEWFTSITDIAGRTGKRGLSTLVPVQYRQIELTAEYFTFLSIVASAEEAAGSFCGIRKVIVVVAVILFGGEKRGSSTAGQSFW